MGKDTITTGTEGIDITRLRNQMEKAKGVQKIIISMVVAMAQESMCPENYEKFCESMTYMAGNRGLDLSDLL